MPLASVRSRVAGLVALLLVLLGGAPAAAAVDITFYSRELGSTFPHAFVVISGQLDRDGSRIDEDYGFTAKAVTPAILFGSVKGEVVSDQDGSYARGSNKHFTVTLSDADAVARAALRAATAETEPQAESGSWPNVELAIID